MSRGDVTANIAAEVQKQEVTPILLVELDFASAPLRVWSGAGPLTWDSKSWTGTGDLGTIEPITETDDVRATGIKLQLTGIPASYISLALGEYYQGRDAKVWLGFLDSTGAVVDGATGPVLLFWGRMDTMNIDDGPETATISVTAENLLADLKRPRERRYSHEQQQADYPGDLGLAFIAGLQDKQEVWD